MQLSHPTSDEIKPNHALWQLLYSSNGFGQVQQPRPTIIITPPKNHPQLLLQLQASALSNKGVSLPCCAADLPTRESKRQQLRGQGTASASASAVRKGLVIPKKKWWAPRTGKDRDGRAKKHCTSGREERHPPIMPPYFTLYSLGHLLSKKKKKKKKKKNSLGRCQCFTCLPRSSTSLMSSP